jgi:putative transposon-encoded protein
MSKKRILSLLLSVLMLVTIVLPIGAFAEENVQEGYEEPVYEEPVDEEPADEEPAYEEPAYEEPVYDEPVDDEPVDEELPVVNFEQEEELVEVASIDEPVVVAAAAITITVQPTSKTVAPGDTAQFGLAAKGTGLTYQWQVQLAGKTTWQDTTLDGNKTKLLSFTALTDYNGRKYRCVVTDSNGNTATTNAATLTVSTSEFIYEDITSTTCRLVKYNGSSTNVSVPQTYNGKTVTEIGPDAFLNNTTLTSIVLPNTITVIGARAFKGCTKLSSMSSVS